MVRALYNKELDTFEFSCLIPREYADEDEEEHYVFQKLALTLCGKSKGSEKITAPLLICSKGRHGTVIFYIIHILPHQRYECTAR